MKEKAQNRYHLQNGKEKVKDIMKIIKKVLREQVQNKYVELSNEKRI